MKTIMFTVRYFNWKMLQTLDLNAVISVLCENGKAEPLVKFEQMSNCEQNESSHCNEGFLAVTCVFMVFESGNSKEVRRFDLETLIFKTGRK